MNRNSYAEKQFWPILRYCSLGSTEETHEMIINSRCRPRVKAGVITTVLCHYSLLLFWEFLGLCLYPVGQI
jgi:hypothetical protein